MSSVELKWESWSEFAPDAQRLMEQEYAEYETIMGLKPLDIDHSAMAGVRVLSARDKGIPVGYFMISIVRDPEVRTSLLALQGAWYVKPGGKYARIGLRLFNEVLARTKSVGCSEIELHHPLVGRGAKLMKFFRRKNARPIKAVYRLVL